MPASLVPNAPDRPRKGRTWPQRLLITGGCLVIALCLGAASLAGYLGMRLDQITRVSDITLRAPNPGQPTNFLLIGTDSREGLPPVKPRPGYVAEAGCNCADTIMVLRVDPDGKHAYLLSLPRDLWIPISGTGKTQRINTAYQHGTQTLIDTIQDNFDIPINHLVQIDFVGFQKLVDAAGGVPLWFDAPVRDRKSGLKVPRAKCQVLDGDQARKFVRSRHLEYQTPDGRWVADGTADLGRITRQQVFVRRVAAKAVKAGLTNPVTLNALVSAGVANVSLDETLTVGDLLRLGRTFARFSSDELRGYSIPAEPMVTSGGAQVLLPRMQRAQTTLNLFRGLPPGSLSPEGVQVRVRNGTVAESRAVDAAGALAALGFRISQVDRFDTSDVRRTTVYYPARGEASGRLVAGHITGGAALVPDESLAMGQVVVVIGSDFTTIHDQPAPKGSADDLRTTTSTVPSTLGGATTTTLPAPTTTVIGYSTGEPPDGVDC